MWCQKTSGWIDFSRGLTWLRLAAHAKTSWITARAANRARSREKSTPPPPEVFSHHIGFGPLGSLSLSVSLNTYIHPQRALFPCDLLAFIRRHDLLAFAASRSDGRVKPSSAAAVGPNPLRGKEPLANSVRLRPVRDESGRASSDHRRRGQMAAANDAYKTGPPAGK